MATGIKSREIVEEVQQSYLEYAMSTIIDRALPDVRDGLKPVHRRILYSMHEMGLHPGARFQKSAKVVGYVLGNYHPHGDTAAYDSMVRMAQDFSLRYPLVHGQGNFGCFTADTKVLLTDGRNVTFKDLVKEYRKGKKNYTYSFNHETKEIEIAEIKQPRLTKKNSPLIEVQLDNGEKVRCTPDHRFMLRSGTYREAQSLEKGDSLMPTYFRLSTSEDDKNSVGYQMVLQPVKNIWHWVHRLADQFNINHNVYPISAGRIRHHVDFNKLNNSPENIKRMSWKEHWQTHYKVASERHKNDPGYVKKLKEGREKYWADPKSRAKAAKSLGEKNKKWWSSKTYREEKVESIKALWAKPEYKEFMREASSHNLKRLWQTESFRRLLSGLKSEELKKRWQNSEYRQRMSEITLKMSTELWLNEDHRQHMSQLQRKRWLDPIYRKKQTNIAKELWNKPEYRNKYSHEHFRNAALLLWQQPGIKEFHKEKAKKQWENPEFRNKISEGSKKRGVQLAKENPGHFKKMAEKAAVSLTSKWQDPEYKKQVVRSKVLGFINSLLKKNRIISRDLYENSRTNNGVPNFDRAIKYFRNLDEMIKQAEVYNHKVTSVRPLKEKDDVYDLTIEKTHNFALAAGVFVHNSIDGDSAAAYRYTEAKLMPIADMVLADIDKDTVNFRDNYDGSHQEPVVLPTRIPNLLINGSMGIAVGMATNIPPHNLGEILDAMNHLIDEPEADLKDLLQYVKGPDFPTGATIYNEHDIVNAYATGRGPVVMRGKAEIVEGKRGFQIIVSEIPYQVNKAELIIKIADLVKEKKIDGIKDLRDESDKEGMRIAVDLKQDAFPRKVLNQLFKYTELQKSFHFNMLALVDGIQPQIMGLKALLKKFIDHRKEVVTRRSRFELQKAKDRAHILDGLKKALDHIDEVIKIIRASSSRDDAAANLRKFKPARTTGVVWSGGFSDKQTAAILEMRLQALAGLERKKVEDELAEKLKLITFLEDLLKSPKKILGVVKEEFKEIREKYGDERRTKVVKSALREIGEEELIPEENSLFMITKDGYVKRMAPDSLKAQKRGGKGLMGMATKEEDVISHFFLANTHDNILFFTNSGKVFQTKGYEVPESSRQSKGKAIVNFLQVSPNDVITAVVPIPKGQKQMYLFMTTEHGVIKKVEMDMFSQVRRNGMIAIKLKGDDRLGWVLPTSGDDQISLVTSSGNAIRFKEKDVRPMGRNASGVIGVRLENTTDRVVGADVIPSGAEKGLNLLVLMENGYGKRSALSSYKIQKRGGHGIMTAKITAKTGPLVSAHVTSEEQKEIIAVSRKGQVIRTSIESISILGRATQGVRVMRLDAGDKLASVVVA